MPLFTPHALLQSLVESAHRNMARDGELHTAVVGYDGVGRFRCGVLQSPDPESDFQVVGEGESRMLLLPAPFQAHAATITEWFAVNRVAWAAFIGEAWLFPPGEESVAATRAFVAGEGPPPSQHPDRVEAAFVSLIAPGEGFMRMEMFSIERRPHRNPVLVSAPEFFGPARDLPDSGSQITADGDVSWLSSWLEECLPHPRAT